MKKLTLIVFCLIISMLRLGAQSSILEKQEQIIKAIELDYLNIVRSVAGNISGHQSISPDITEESSEMVLTEKDDLEEYLPVNWPVAENYNVSSGYGYRTDPFTGKRAFHNGIDIPMPINTPVYATAAGIVLRTGSNKASGKYIIVEHKNSYRTTYAHLNKISVEEGEKVKPDTIIGYSGNTGRSTGPHLHYQISHRGVTINPLLLTNF